MAGIGDAWGTREEMLHPRGKDGRFVKKLKTAVGIVDQIQRIMAEFSRTLRTFQTPQQQGQYAFNIAKPGRFRGGADLPRYVADFDNVQEDLRDGVMDDPSTKRFVAMMDSSAIELPDSLILSRVVGPDAFGLTPEQMDAEEGGIRDFQGSLIADRGYSPTTLGDAIPAPAGNGRVTMRIAAPKGTKAIPIGDGPNDRRINLDRDQEYQVTKVQEDGQGGYFMSVVATPRTPGATPPPEAGHVGPGKPKDREAQIRVLQESRKKRLAVPAEAPPPQAAPAPEQAVPRAPGVPPQGEAPEARRARRQQVLGGGGPAPTAPAPAPSPAPSTEPVTAPGAPPVPTAPGPVDLKTAVREAGLPSPSAGKRRLAWNNAYLGLKSGKKDPEDALRDLESDIKYWETVLADDRRSDTDPGPLPGDIDALKQLRDLIQEKYGLGGRGEQEPASEAPPAPTPEAPPAPKPPAKKAAPKAAVPKKAPAAKKAAAPTPRKVAPPREGDRVPVEEGKPSFTRAGRQPAKALARTQAPGEAEGERVPIQEGRPSFTRPRKESVSPPREVAEPVSVKGREELGRGFVAPVKREARIAAKATRAPSKATTAPVTKAAREEEQEQLAELRRTLANLPENAPTRPAAERLLAQMEEDQADDELVRDWISGSGVREAGLTETERAHVARVARDIRTGKISPAEGARDLRTANDPKLEKIARRVEGGEKVKTPRKPKTEPIDELDGMTVVELKRVAKEEGIKGYSKLKRDEIKKAIRDKRGGASEVEETKGPLSKADALAELDKPTTTVARMREIAKEFDISTIRGRKKEDIRDSIKSQINATESGRPETGSPDAVKAAPATANEPIVLSKLGVDAPYSPTAQGDLRNAQRELRDGASPQDIADHLRTKAEEYREGETWSEDEAFSDRIRHSRDDIRETQNRDARILEAHADALEKAAASTPKKAAIKRPQKAAPPVQAKLSTDEYLKRFTGYDFENPPSREEAAAGLENFTRADLLDIAKKLNIPGAGSRTKADLRNWIVEATVGRRIDSIATRGFTGTRPGEGRSLRPPTRLTAAPPKKAAPNTPQGALEQILSGDRNDGLPSSDLDPDLVRGLASDHMVEVTRPSSVGGVPVEVRTDDPTVEGARVRLTPIGRVKAAHPDWSDEQISDEAIRVEQEMVARGDRGRAVHRFVGTIDQTITNGGSDRALLHNIRAGAKRGDITPEQRDRLISLAEAGDRDGVMAEVDSIRDAAGLTNIGGRVDSEVPFDPRIHKVMGKRPPVGGTVRVVQPGHWMTGPDGRRVLLERADVIDDTPSPAPAKKAVPRKATPADRVTALLMDRIAERDPAVRDEIMANLDPADRDEVREAIARVGGEVPPVTDAEVKIIKVPVTREQADALKRATADELREAARIEGLDIPEGGDKAEVQRNIERAIIQRELDKRMAAKAAKKAAPRKAAPRPAGAFEGLDVKEIGKGLDLSAIPQGYLDSVQKDLDEGKMTPAAIGRQLDDWIDGSTGPAYSRAVLHAVSGDNNRRRLADLRAEEPSPERDRLLEYEEAREREIAAEAAKLTRQIEESRKLAERLKATRRKRATAPKPQEPTLTPREEAQAAEVADLAGVPETKVQARIKERKAAKAAPSLNAQGVLDLLGAVTTREEGEALIRGKTKVELTDIAKAAGVPVLSSYNKDRIAGDIIERTVGSRLDRVALKELSRGMMSSGVRDEPQTGFGDEWMAEVRAGQRGTALRRVADIFEGLTPDQRQQAIHDGDRLRVRARMRPSDAYRQAAEAARSGERLNLEDMDVRAQVRGEIAAPSRESVSTGGPVAQTAPGTAKGKITTARLLPGTRITVRETDPITGQKLPAGTAAPTARKTGGVSARVVSTHYGDKGRRRIVLETDDGRRLEVKSASASQTFFLAPEQGAAPAKAAPAKAAPVTEGGPLRPVRPEYDPQKGLQARPNADEPLRLAPLQMSGAGNLHADSEMGQLWEALYRDDRTPNSVLNILAELASEMASGARPMDEVLRDVRRLMGSTDDPVIQARIERAVDAIDAPRAKIPDLPEGTPEVLRDALRRLATIPTARKTGRIGDRRVEQSVLDKKIDIVRRIANGDISPFDAQSQLSGRDLHESTDGATQMWAIMGALIRDHKDELFRWAREARKRAQG